MCGIAGLVCLNRTVERSELERMAELLRHRGPDHTGIYHERHLGLVSTRLSIQDLSHAADMPLWNAEAQIAIVYNGEVYNFRELRASLIKQGHTFRTTGDTEVVLNAWKEWGPGCLLRFNGMFAFAVLDQHQRRLWLARDRFGKKTVYYYYSGETLVFASEVKAIWALNSFCLTLDDRAVLEYLTADHIKGTMFREIEALEPGEYIEFDLHDLHLVRRKRYFRLSDWIDKEKYLEMRRCKSRTIEHLTEEHLERAVMSRLVSDAPLGVMCSGGVDSSLVTLRARKHTNQIDVFTVDIPGHLVYSEAEYAAELCQKIGARHHVFNLGRNDYLREVVDNIYYNDLPPAHLGSSIGIYLVCRMARERGIKVLLSGEGADEIFCGYQPRYRRHYWRCKILMLRHLLRLIPNALRDLLTDQSVFDANVLKGIATNELAIIAARSAMNRMLYEELCDQYREFAGRDADILAMSLIDLVVWLQPILLRTDRASMQASVEARIPFLDDELVRLALNMPYRWRMSALEDKIILKRILAKEMGHRFAFRPKVGFGVRPYLRDLNLVQLFNGGFVREYFGPGILRLASNHEELLHKLILLEIWHRLFCARLSREEVRALCENSSSQPSNNREAALCRADREALALFAGSGEPLSEAGILRRGDVTHFAATIASSVIGVFSSVVAAKFLTPRELGIVQSVMLLASYFGFLDFGVTSGLFRNVPLTLGRGDTPKVRKMVNAAWLVVRGMIAVGTGVSASVMVWGFFRASDPLFGWAALGLMSQMVWAPVETLYVILYRSVQEFHVLGKRLNWKNLFLIFSLGLPAVAGAAGLVARYVLTPIAGTLLLRPGLPLRPTGRGSWREAVALAKVGFPILLVNVLTSLLMVADRSVVALMLGPEAVGQYALASLVLAGLPVLPAALGAILYPRAAHQFGRHGSSKALAPFFWRSLRFNMAVLAPICAVAYFTIPPLVRWLLPAYQEGIRPAQLACISCVFLAYIGPANILIVVRRNLLYGIFLLLATAIVWVAGWLLGTSNWGIEGVAIGRILANAVLCLLVVTCAGSIVRKDITCEDQ